jgi:hypothetical protein
MPQNIFGTRKESRNVRPTSIVEVASDGAYLSIPETAGLRIINCLRGCDSDGEIGPFLMLW